MEVVNIHDAKSQLSMLIKKVLNGEKVIIAKNNQPIVEIVPIIKKKRIPGLLKGKIEIIGTWEDSDKEIEKMFEESEIFPR